MSLLEDVFLNGEAQELERIVEGDEFDERPGSASPNSDENSEKEDEAEEDKRRVDPSEAKPKRVIKNPRFILNPARLTGPRGIQVLPEHFKDFKFKGKGSEREDLDLVLKKLEHWAYRLYPKFEFVDCLRKIETLGKKRPVMVHLHKIRTDQITSEETVTQKDSSDEETQKEQEVDEFDLLLQQQIDLARATPVPDEHQHSAKKAMETPLVDKFIMPKATSSPSINDEQRERMLRNRRLAEERRLARLKQNSFDNNTSNDNINNDSGNKDTSVPNDNNINDSANNRNDSIISKKYKSNVIDSSDDEYDNNDVDQSITVDVHSANSEISKENDENTNDNIINKKHTKSNVIDSSDDDYDNNDVDQSITVDVHSANSELSQRNDEKTNDNDNMINKKHSESNIIDNLNDDSDNNVDQSITVDIHGTNSDISQTNYELTNDNVDNTRNNDTEMIVDSTSHNNDKVNNDISNPQQNILVNKTNDSDINNSNVTKEINKSLNCDNLHENENVTEDIMDVDFSDDF